MKWGEHVLHVVSAKTPGLVPQIFGHSSPETKADPKNLWDLQETLGKPWLEELHSSCDHKKTVGTHDTKIRPWRAWTPESWAWTAAASWTFCSKNPEKYPRYVLFKYPGITNPYISIHIPFGWDWNPQAYSIREGSTGFLGYIHWLLVETDGVITN